jgi:hypothetical protein
VENISRTLVRPIDVTCGGKSYCSPGIPYSFDVTEIVKRAQADGRTWASMALYTAAGQYHSGKYFWTREGGDQAPVVRIAYTLGETATWTPTPTPSPTATVIPAPTSHSAWTPTATATASPASSATPMPSPTSVSADTPTPTPITNTPRGLAILGDSFFDEYRADNARGGAYAATTFNNVELLARLRGLNLGPWGTRAEPRRTGYEYNWARSGATSYSLIQQGQHTGAAAQIRAGLVDYVLIGIGANDYSPNFGDTYQRIYSGAMSDSALAAKERQHVTDVTTAVDAVLDAGARGVGVVLFTEWGLDPSIATRFPNAAGRQRVDDSIRRVNAGLEAMAAGRGGVVIIDQNAIGRERILPGLDSQGNFTVGGEKISFLTNGDEPHHVRLADGSHVGTVMSGRIANWYIVEPFDAAFGFNIAPLTDAEILSAAGIRPA